MNKYLFILLFCCCSAYGIEDGTYKRIASLVNYNYLNRHYGEEISYTVLYPNSAPQELTVRGGTISIGDLICEYETASEWVEIGGYPPKIQAAKGRQFLNIGGPYTMDCPGKQLVNVMDVEEAEYFGSGVSASPGDLKFGFNNDLYIYRNMRVYEDKQSTSRKSW